VEVFKREKDLIVAMPKIIYPDGSFQRLCKLLPTPIDLIIRRFLPLKFLKELINKTMSYSIYRQMKLWKCLHYLVVFDSKIKCFDKFGWF